MFAFWTSTIVLLRSLFSRVCWKRLVELSKLAIQAISWTLRLKSLFLGSSFRNTAAIPIKKFPLLKRDPRKIPGRLWKCFCFFLFFEQFPRKQNLHVDLKSFAWCEFPAKAISGFLLLLTRLWNIKSCVNDYIAFSFHFNEETSTPTSYHFQISIGGLAKWAELIFMLIEKCLVSVAMKSLSHDSPWASSTSADSRREIW